MKIADVGGRLIEGIDELGIALVERRFHLRPLDEDMFRHLSVELERIILHGAVAILPDVVKNRGHGGGHLAVDLSAAETGRISSITSKPFSLSVVPVSTISTIASESPNKGASSTEPSILMI